MKKLIFIICSIVLLSGCNNLNTNNISSLNKSMSEKGDLMIAEGRWAVVDQKSSNSLIPKINSVSITCDKTKMTCSELQAKLFTPEDFSDLNHNLLYPEQFFYKVLEWEEGIIIAVRKAPVADIRLRISIPDGVVEKSFRETKARGSETADPTIHANWVLK
ncbi:MAG: membrane lipoprotein lipid attachment site-containing protein [Candidatus Omnitrophica bacterium]|nr:membrane lipoprotein lipid attachment site-containing protein [Candidatus Omnitrophota bacterium]